MSLTTPCAGSWDFTSSSCVYTAPVASSSPSVPHSLPPTTEQPAPLSKACRFMHSAAMCRAHKGCAWKINHCAFHAPKTASPVATFRPTTTLQPSPPPSFSPTRPTTPHRFSTSRPILKSTERPTPQPVGPTTSSPTWKYSVQQYYYYATLFYDRAAFDFSGHSSRQQSARLWWKGPA